VQAGGEQVGSDLLALHRRGARDQAVARRYAPGPGDCADLHEVATGESSFSRCHTPSYIAPRAFEAVAPLHARPAAS
jgi:hypothetical protein